MTRTMIAAATLLSLFFAGHAGAQGLKIRPGLWEHSFTMQSRSGQMEQAMREAQQQLASMPPEQRKMMEEMMARQGVGMGAGGRTVKICITKAQAERDELPQHDRNCRQQIVQRKGNTMKLKFTCAGNPPTNGESDVTFLSPTSYTAKSRVDTTVDGRAERMNMEQHGKWLAADCGSVRPMAP